MKTNVPVLFSVLAIVLSACTLSAVVSKSTNETTVPANSTLTLPAITPLPTLLYVGTNTPLFTVIPLSTAIPTPLPTVYSTPQQGLYFYNVEESAYKYVYPNNLAQISVRLGSESVEFANFADRLLRFTWDVPSELWISDFTLRNNTKMSEDSLPECPSSWYWSPDDLHLICDAEDASESGVIYLLETATWDTWPYECDRVALSPRTGQLATWCLSTIKPGSFGIIEWGGEIWFSADAPALTVVQTTPKIQDTDELWGWSADGKKIAYFDSIGSFIVANANGVPLQTLSGG